MGADERARGRVRSLANLQPETAAMTHGAWARQGVLLPRDKCVCHDCLSASDKSGVCETERKYLEQRRGEVLRLTHITPVDWPLVEVLVWTELRIQRAARWLAYRGEIADSGPLDWQPLAAKLPALLNTHQRLCDALGLTPTSRARLQANEDTAARAIADAFRAVTGAERGTGHSDAPEVSVQ